ncbi:MAG: CPBP family glutamic-type intramembrane protease [Candidatus Binatus sp.]|uniref:CPBP family glutamic-type intramembrane protease n=1 Tax=Candidatus Binatus sp. TaxID=2811406 RepID=UPI003C7868C5
MEDEAVEGHPQIYPGDQVIESSVDGSGGARAPHSAWRRESALLIALTIAGAVTEYPLALTIKPVGQSEIWRVIPFLGVTLVLASLVPVALRINGQLGLPGAPLIAAKIAGEKIHFSIRSLARVSIGYAILAAAAGAGVLMIVIVPLVFIARGGAGISLPKPPMLTVAPGRIAIVGASVAIAAAVSEEIQFRLVMYAIFGWIGRLISRDSSGYPGRRALWIITIAQGYLFGIIHLMPVGGALFHSTSKFLIGGLVMPQTWEGVVFGRLYLRRGLEASMLAHASMDVALFALAAIGMLRSHLGAG